MFKKMPVLRPVPHSLLSTAGNFSIVGVLLILISFSFLNCSETTNCKNYIKDFKQLNPQEIFCLNNQLINFRYTLLRTNKDCCPFELWQNMYNTFSQNVKLLFRKILADAIEQSEQKTGKPNIYVIYDYLDKVRYQLICFDCNVITKFLDLKDWHWADIFKSLSEIFTMLNGDNYKFSSKENIEISLADDILTLYTEAFNEIITQAIKNEQIQYQILPTLQENLYAIKQNRHTSITIARYLQEKIISPFVDHYCKPKPHFVKECLMMN